MKKFALVMGLVLAMGAGLFYSDVIAQSDPWWHPLNPQGGSHGVTYGTNLPTLANTGYPPTDGLLAVQITTGGVPTLNMYDQSTTAWLTFTTLGGAGAAMTDDTIPVWDATAGAFEDSLLSDDGTDVTLASGSLLLPNGTAVLPGWGFTSQARSGARVFGATSWDLQARGVADATTVLRLAGPSGGGSADLSTVIASLPVMNGSDTQRGLFVDLTNANHTGASNLLYGIGVDSITGDADAYESAISLGGGFDTHIHFTETGATPPDNPPAGTVAMFVDDNADYSGAGGNDCILGMIDSAGTITVVATMILNGACP